MDEFRYEEVFPKEEFMGELENNIGNRLRVEFENVNTALFYFLIDRFHNLKIPKKILLNYSLESKVEIGKLIKKSDKRILFAPITQISKEGRVLSNPSVMKKQFLNILK